jgi:hypothetical protein
MYSLRLIYLENVGFLAPVLLACASRFVEFVSRQKQMIHGQLSTYTGGAPSYLLGANLSSHIYRKEEPGSCKSSKTNLLKRSCLLSHEILEANYWLSFLRASIFDKVSLLQTLNFVPSCGHSARFSLLHPWHKCFCCQISLLLSFIFTYQP